MAGERLVRFEDEHAKARWLDAAAALDAHDGRVRRRALELTQATTSNEERAQALYRWVRDAIAYRRDTPWTWGTVLGRERFDSAATVLRRRWDDCDGKARLLVALVRALRAPGLEARIRPVFAHGRFTHVQAELRWPGSRESRTAFRHVDADGWVPAETILRRARLGDLPSDVPRETSGVWRT